MNRHQKLFVCLAVVATAGILAAELSERLQNPVAPTEAGGVSAEQAEAEAVREASGPERTSSPMMVEIRAVLETEQTQLAALQERFDGAADAGEALAIEREIEQLKVGTEFRILQIQAEHARIAGHIDQAIEIERAIEEMTNPPVQQAPRPRAARADRIGR